MRPILEAVASEHRETFAIALLDIDNNRQTPTKYRVGGIPDYRVFKNGKVVAKLVGAIPKANFVNGILNSLK